MIGSAISEILWFARFHVKKTRLHSLLFLTDALVEYIYNLMGVLQINKLNFVIKYRSGNIKHTISPKTH